MIFYLRRLKASELHSDLSQVARLRELDRFARGESDFLICTDVAARGLDIKDVQSVINYDMPNSLKTYIHRVGRTARAGKSGVAVSFTSELSRNLLKKIVRRAKARKEEVQQRVIPTEAIQYWKTRITEMSDKIENLQERVQIEKEMKRAAKQIDLTGQLTKEPQQPGQSKIISRPAGQWIDEDEIRKEVDREFEEILREERQNIAKSFHQTNKRKRKRGRRAYEDNNDGGRDHGGKETSKTGKKRQKRDIAREKRDAAADTFLQKYNSAVKKISTRNARR